jgi:C4-dicarboxylate-specific signal transduction histidine kinase
MSTDSVAPPSGAALASSSDEALLLLNRATVVMHSVRALAHELNNIRQMISGSAELLEMNPEVPASMRPRLQAIANQTSRGCDLVSAVADLARAMPPRGHTVDVRRAIDRVSQLRKFEQSRAAVDLAVTVPAEPLLLRVDAPDLQLMLLNLVINAEQAMTEAASKVVTLTAAKVGDTCQIIVGDAGQGTLRDVDYFSPFLSTRPPNVAAGLGLWATRLLAAKYGGEVALRQGSSGVEAVLTLPMAAGADKSG